MNQIFAPLLSVISDEESRRELREFARTYNRDLINDRGSDMEAQVLEVIRDALANSASGQVSVKDIATWFADRQRRRIRPQGHTQVDRQQGAKKLQLKTCKGHGVFVIAATEGKRLEMLYRKYGFAGDITTEETKDVPVA